MVSTTASDRILLVDAGRTTEIVRPAFGLEFGDRPMGLSQV